MPEEQNKQKSALRAVLGAVKISENALSSTIADPNTDLNSRAALKAVKKHFDFLFATAELANKVIEDQASKSISREQEIVSEQGKDYILPLDDSKGGWAEFIDNLARKKALLDTVIPPTGDHIGKKPDSQTAGTETGRFSSSSPNFVNAPGTKPSDRIESSLDHCLEVMNDNFDRAHQTDLLLVAELVEGLAAACNSSRQRMASKLELVEFRAKQDLIDALFRSRAISTFFEPRGISFTWSSHGSKANGECLVTFNFTKLKDSKLLKTTKEA